MTPRLRQAVTAVAQRERLDHARQLRSAEGAQRSLPSWDVRRKCSSVVGTGCQGPLRRSARCLGAVTHDGRRVAVKVRHPRGDAPLGADVGWARVLLEGLRHFWPGLDAKVVAAELRGGPGQVRLRSHLRHRWRPAPGARAAGLPAQFVVLQRVNLELVALPGPLHACGKWAALAAQAWPGRCADCPPAGRADEDIRKVGDIAPGCRGGRP
jgi:hypothetical protein